MSTLKQIANCAQLQTSGTLQIYACDNEYYSVKYVGIWNSVCDVESELSFKLDHLRLVCCFFAQEAKVIKTTAAEAAFKDFEVSRIVSHQSTKNGHKTAGINVTSFQLRWRECVTVCIFYMCTVVSVFPHIFVFTPCNLTGK